MVVLKKISILARFLVQSTYLIGHDSVKLKLCTSNVSTTVCNDCLYLISTIKLVLLDGSDAFFRQECVSLGPDDLEQK